MNNKYSELFENMVRILDAAVEIGGLIDETDKASKETFEHDVLDVLIDQFGDIADQYEDELHQYKNTVEAIHSLFCEKYGNYIIQNYKRFN
jgi:hypothetical protein